MYEIESLVVKKSYAFFATFQDFLKLVFLCEILFARNQSRLVVCETWFYLLCLVIRLFLSTKLSKLIDFRLFWENQRNMKRTISNLNKTEQAKKVCKTTAIWCYRTSQNCHYLTQTFDLKSIKENCFCFPIAEYWKQTNNCKPPFWARKMCLGIVVYF